MSKELIEFTDKNGNILYVRAFVGFNGDASIQFTTRNDYIQLNSEEIKKLIIILKNRINIKEGFRATD